MSEAQRLKMTGGHFIWIWADTSSTAEFFQPNNVPNVDDKDQIMNTKSNYDSRLDDFVERKTNYDNSESPTEHQYYQQQQNGNKRLQQNSTRYKSLNTNSNRFHHIIGLRNPGEELAEDAGLPSVLPDRSFLKNDKFGSDMSRDQVPVKNKRANQDFNKHSEEGLKDAVLGTSPIENDYTSSYESGKTSNNLNIKNINSQEFNANYYDPYLSSRREGESDNNENIFDNNSDESANEENSYYDYDKSNPFKANPDATSASFTTTTKRSMSDMVANRNVEKTNINRNSNKLNRNNRVNGGNDKMPIPLDQITTIPYSKFFDDNDDLDLEGFSESSNDLKAKRADNFPSAFNISSHVFFHHFKDFPVGLLALRHIKMNIDRVFVRSAIRLFATTWSRVEKDEELRQASGGKVGGRKNNWQDNWSSNDNDFDEPNNNNNNLKNKKQKNKTNVNVNSRHNNARGSKKYKRAAQEVEKVAEATQTSISKLVNSSNKTSNSNNKLINNLTNIKYSQHVSDLSSHPSDDVNKSNNDNVKNYNLTRNSNLTKLNESATPKIFNQELINEVIVAGKIEVQKRQNTWWTDTLRGRNQEKTKSVRGTPHYKGGCFGSPSRSDLKRSELFARFVCFY